MRLRVARSSGSCADVGRATSGRPTGSGEEAGVLMSFRRGAAANDSLKKRLLLKKDSTSDIGMSHRRSWVGWAGSAQTKTDAALASVGGREREAVLHRCGPAVTALPLDLPGIDAVEQHVQVGGADLDAGA